MTRRASARVVGLTLATLSGCASLTERGATGSSATEAPTESTGYEPAMLELATVKDGDGQWRLLIAGGMHAKGDAPRSKVAFTRAGEADRWKYLDTWITVFGGAQVVRERGTLQAREIDNLPMITNAGTYALELDLGGSLVTVPVEIDVTTRATSSAPLACQKRETSLDVKSRGAKLDYTPENPMRKKELVALFKSEETRKVLAGLVELRRSRGDSMMSSGMAARPAARPGAVTPTSKDIAKVEKQNAALVNKHGG